MDVLFDNWPVVVKQVSTLAELSDGDLVQQIHSVALSGGAASEAEAEIYRRFAPRVKLFGMRHLKQEADAIDLVQRVMVLTILKVREGRVRQPEQLASFVLGTARMTCKELGRASRREVLSELPSIEALASMQVDAGPMPEARLGHCLQALSERERTVMLLGFFHEEDASSIAKSLALSEGNVRIIRHRALQNLRACMGIEPHEVLS